MTQVDYKTAFKGTLQDKEALMLAMVKNSDIDVMTIVEYCRSVSRQTYIDCTTKKQSADFLCPANLNVVQPSGRHVMCHELRLFVLAEISSSTRIVPYFIF